MTRDTRIEIYGPDEAELKVKDSYIKKILKIEEDHYKKYGLRSMSTKQPDELFGK